jgi:hypothetical protein
MFHLREEITLTSDIVQSATKGIHTYKLEFNDTNFNKTRRPTKQADVGILEIMI